MKRILPAYYAVAIVSLIAGFLIYLPNDLHQLYQSAWSTYLFDSLAIEELSLTLEQLVDDGRAVVLLAEIPRYEKSYAQIAMSSRGLLTPEIQTSPAVGEVNRLLRALSDKFQNVRYLDLAEADDGRLFSSPVYNERPIYLDGGHLSVYGAKFIASKLSVAERARDESRNQQYW
ncbi:hypothetical protein A3752_12225 [Oleiphilus sp. HI0081]|nr:hypothetical protein A3752_12225 [Oleiphilus sp. HI0081]